MRTMNRSQYGWPIGPSQPVYLRTGEILLFTRTSDAQCSICHGGLVHAMVAWDHRITLDPFGTMGEWEPGEDRFSGLRHTDGTAPHSEHHSFEYARSRCAKCKTFDSLTTSQGGYGDTVTCNACGDSNYHSIGD